MLPSPGMGTGGLGGTRPASKVTPSVGRACLRKMGLMSPLFSAGQVPGKPLTPLIFQLEQAGEGRRSREGRGPRVGRERALSRALDTEGESRSSLAWPAGLIKQLLLPLSGCFQLSRVRSFLNEVALLGCGEINQLTKTRPICHSAERKRAR